MKIQKILLISFGVKLSIILVCISVFFGHYIIGLLWFDNPTATISSIKASLHGNLQNVDARNDEGFTGLMLFAAKTDSDRVNLFLDAGAKINLKADNDVGDSALHIACYNGGDFTGGFETIKVLVSRGANVRIGNNRGDEPIHHSIMIDDIDLHFDVIDLLVKNGANINAQDGKGMTILHFNAGNNNQVWVREYLRRFGSLVDLNVKTTEGLTAAQYADSLGFNLVSREIETSKKYIITKVRERDKGGLTGLMLAAIKGDVARAQRLIKLNADVNVKSNDKYLQTSLHFALMHQNPAIVALLIQDNAKTDIPNAQGDFPIHYIAKLDTIGDQSKALKLFIDSKANVNKQNDNGETLLHLLVRKDDRVFLDTLAREYGYLFNATIKNKKNMTPLELAKKLNRATLIKVLEDLEHIAFIQVAG